MTRPVVEVHDLRKTYGSIRAVDGVSFQVMEGEIFGLVGPNGAGKTTTIEIIEGLRRPDAGQVRVLGLDPWKDARELVLRIGVQLQEAGVLGRVRVWELVSTMAALYPRTRDPKTLLERLGLQGQEKTFTERLSGGQKQRLFAVLALINDPEVVFLDEITTGLDPHIRRDIWDFLRELRNQGKTIFLTTHYMEEAEALCDRVAIMDHGRIVALDAPERLIRRFGGERCIVLEPEPEVQVDWGAILKDVEGVTRVEVDREWVRVYGGGDRFLVRVLQALEDRGIPYRHVRTQDPSLEDVFLALTGRPLPQNGG